MRFIAFSTFFFYSCPSRFLIFYKIRILNQHKKVLIHKSSSKSEFKKIAIVALYPRKAVLISVLRLIDELVKRNYHVIVVVNEQRKWIGGWLHELEQRELDILIRPNIGRDFGAYKLGIDYAKSLSSYSSAQRLLLANDSVYYFPSSVKFLDGLLRSTDEWSAMYVNFQFHLHAQSFFQSFSSNIFRNEEFINFWGKYYPTDIRHKVIYKGEVGLTRKILQAGFYPKAYVSPHLIESSPKFRIFREEDKFALWSGFGFIDIDKLVNSNSVHLLKLKNIFSTQNPTHHASLVATRVLGAPMKLDLFRTGLASLADILETVQIAGISGGELAEFESNIASQGGISTLVGLRKLWGRFGYQ
jgi:hypothetical protein